MSSKYKHGDRVPTEILCKRIDDLVKIITKGRRNLDNEFSMHIPAELDYDADLVMSEVSRRLKSAEQEIGLMKIRLDHKTLLLASCEKALEARDETAI